MNVEIAGVRYHVEQCGNGFPTVLLHGFTGDSSIWTPFCHRWGSHSRLIIPDIIGHGQTQSPTTLSRYMIESAAQDLARILDQLAVEQIDLLGYSMGGRLALTFAVLYPNRVRKLILESASPGLLTEEEKCERRMKDAELAKLIIEKGIEAFVDYWEEIPLFASMKRLPKETRMKIRELRLANSPVGLTNSLLGMGTGSQASLWDRLNQLSSDVLLLTGKEDQKFCVIAEQMKPLFKNAAWISFENCGHAIHVEDNEKFGTIVSDFLFN